MARQDVLDDRQTKARASGFARAAAVDTIEALGQTRNMDRIDTDAGIPHRELRTLSINAPHEIDLSALWRVAHRVARQIGERAVDLLAAAQQHTVPLHLQRHRVASGRQQFGVLMDFLHQRGDIDLLFGRCRRPRFKR